MEYLQRLPKFKAAKNKIETLNYYNKLCLQSNATMKVIQSEAEIPLIRYLKKQNKKVKRVNSSESLKHVRKKR